MCRTVRGTRSCPGGTRRHLRTSPHVSPYTRRPWLRTHISPRKCGRVHRAVPWRSQLIGGKKFDLRLYVLVTSYAPLTVYMYRSGFARFSSYRYNTNHKNLGDTFVHLTNVAVQKTGPGFDAGAGSKWPLRAYRLFLVGKYGHQATDKMFLDVEELCINTLLSVQKVMISDKHCFEMYGYDEQLPHAPRSQPLVDHTPLTPLAQSHGILGDEQRTPPFPGHLSPSPLCSQVRHPHRRAAQAVAARGGRSPPILGRRAPLLHLPY